MTAKNISKLQKNNSNNNTDINQDDKNKQNFIAKNILLELIKPREDQPRKIFNQESLQELTLSIKAKGVLQPIIVRPIANGCYQIIVGERRWRAARAAGLNEIPALIRDTDAQDSMSLALIENIQRENLRPLEEAWALHNLLSKYGLTHSELADSIGKSRASVSNLLRLLNLEPQVQNLVNNGSLEMGHARALLSLSGAEQIKAAQLVADKNLSVRETEKLVQHLNRVQGSKEALNLIPANFEFQKLAQEWEEQVTEKLAAKVKVKYDPNGKGMVMIYFESFDEANWLINNIKFGKL